MFRRLLVSLPAVVCLSAVQAQAQQTPPVAPKVQETPLPPPVVLPPPPSLPSDLPSRPLTADEVVAIALRHQPTITSARADVSGAQGRVQQVRSGLLPSLGVGAGYSYVDVLAGAGGGSSSVGTSGGGAVVSVPGYQAAINLRQLIFDFNHTKELVHQAVSEELSLQYVLTRTESDLALQVKQGFYTYVQNQRLVTVNENNVHNQQDHLAEAQARLRAGLGLPSDVVRAETAVSEAVLNLNLARNAADVSRVSLALVMGIDPRTPLQAANTDEPSIPSNDVTALVNTGLRQRPEVLEAQALVDAAQHAVSAAKTTSAPSFAGNVGASTRDDQLPPRNGSLSIGISIGWTPFDSGLTAGLVKQARAQLTSAQAQLTGTQLTVTSDVSQAYLNLRTAEQRIVTSDSEVANAQESVRLAEGRYRSGLGTFLDITDAQTALLTAQTNRVNAQSAVDQARAALTRAIGTPVPASP